MIRVRVTSDFAEVKFVDVPNLRTNGVRLLRVDGLATAEVRCTSEAERDIIVNAPYSATWLGWHRGQCPAYGQTPEEAVQKLAAGDLAQ